MGVLGRKMKKLDFPLHHFLNIALPLEREHTRGLQEFEFLASQIAVADGGNGGGLAPASEDEPLLRASCKPLYVVADNLRSAFNIGSIFRTAECLGARRLYLCGYTATPEDAQVQKTTMGAHEHVEWEWARTALEAVEQLRAQGISCVALETVKGAPMCWDYAFPSPCALVLGNERHGVGPDLLAACVATVQLPCVGVKNSMNVGVAFGMCAHEMLRQWAANERSAGALDALAPAAKQLQLTSDPEAGNRETGDREAGEALASGGAGARPLGGVCDGPGQGEEPRSRAELVIRAYTGGGE
ncbi:Alpha/beta knot methyltransferase [Pavlovales sp. CCMP2436]|nr:Alpha/beta knot methyltransferase [Pavlovales sp. CCMP2436]